MDIPEIANNLSKNPTAWKRRESLCFHLQVPKEDIENIISLAPYPFFLELLQSWSLRDDTWNEHRLNSALTLIGVTGVPCKA